VAKESARALARLQRDFDRWLPPKKSAAERERDRNEFTEMFVADVTEHARTYYTNRRIGYPDPEDMGMLTRNQQLGLGASYRGHEPPPRIKQAVLNALHEEPVGGIIDEPFAAKINSLMAEVFRLSLERLNAELEEQG